ncbi:MAG: cysteine desulfurase NifS [Acidobacteriota bacterium]
MDQRIYLDNSATTPMDPAVLESMLPYFRENFGNASSVHLHGQHARKAVEEARRAVADFIGAETKEIVFTSGGTESDNAALWGIFRSGYRPGSHIITTKIEHSAVLETCMFLEKQGAEVTYLPVDSTGRVDPEAVEDAVRDETILISVMHANNETGIIQPVEEIHEIAERHGIVLHTDAVQTIGKIPVKVKDLGVDLLSLSAHKIHGPKGLGVLYIRKGTKFRPLVTGGAQERRRRAGTENVAAIVGLGTAARLAGERLPEMATRVAKLRDRLESYALEHIPGVGINGRADRLPNITNLSFERLEGEGAVIALDLEGLSVSTGSACTSGSVDPSHVLLAMGLRPDVVESSLRFSLSYHNTEEEIDRAAGILESVLLRLRKLSKRASF